MSQRKLARIVRIDRISPVADADTLDAAHVGGWTVVVGRNQFAAGDIAVYFEIDAFLPEGHPAWQFLVDKYPRTFEDMRGHVLRTMTLRGQVSQGLLLKPSEFPELVGLPLTPGTNVTDRLGVLKYDKPVPVEMFGRARGPFPADIPQTDQERIQNLAPALATWQLEAQAWEVTEKLEGASCTFAWLEDGLHACSPSWDLMEIDGNVQWRLARQLKLAERLARHYPGRRLALQGEVVGAGVQGNIYRLKHQEFWLYDVFDVERQAYFDASARLALARTLDVPHVPVIAPALVLDTSCTMEALLAMADGKSVLREAQAREGLVFKRLDGKVSFKAISNRYLGKQKS